MSPQFYQTLIATPVLMLHVLLVVLLGLMIFGKDKWFANHFKKRGMIYGLVAAIAALVGSLGFSEGFDYLPCKLCWVQRAFHYPQVILFAVALWIKDQNVWKYSLSLSVIGMLVAGYQVLIQFFPQLGGSEVCGIVPAAGGCSKILIQAYNYISIPVMSFTIFVCLIVLAMYQRRKSS